MQWFKAISDKSGSKIDSEVIMKWNDQIDAEENVKQKDAEVSCLLKGLFDENCGYIYISQNNEFFCPIGF